MSDTLCIFDSHSHYTDAAFDPDRDALLGSFPEKGVRRCMICGYIVEMDELPDDFTCPMCGMGRDMFERVEL